MELSFEIVAKFDPVAYYAAIVATGALAWNIFIWLRTGPRLKLSISTNMTFVPASYGYKESDTFVVYTVSNVGTLPTTITHVVLYGYTTWFDYVRRKAIKTALVNSGPPLSHAVPYVLKNGETFSAVATQDEMIRKWSRQYRLYGAVIHSGSDRDVRTRIMPIQEPDTGKN